MKNLNIPSSTLKIAFALMAIILLIVFYKKLMQGFAGVANFFSSSGGSDSGFVDPPESLLTYSEGQYDIFADTLQTAMSRSSGRDDEQTIYNVFKLLKSNADFEKLIVTYGRRWFIRPDLFPDKANLVETIQKKLAVDEISEINGILASNNVNYNF